MRGGGNRFKSIFGSWARVVGLAMVLAIPPAVAAEAVKVFVAPGESVVLGEPTPCTTVDQIDPKYGQALVATTPRGQQVIYTAPQTRVEELFLHVQQGNSPPKNGVCEGAKTADFRITIDPTPNVSNETLGQAFRLLLLAFVVATLLESAFALIFNWRLFQEFFVGRAWRTLIMFFGSLGVVCHFNLDVMAALVRTYDPGLGLTNSTGSSGFSKFLSAMILAGGSSGINRILVALGFRSLVRPDTEKPLPEKTEGWISVRVDDTRKGAKRSPAHVSLVEVVNADDATKTAGFRLISSLERLELGSRIWEVFFPSLSRVPRSGGYSLSPGKYYRLTVVWKEPETEAEKRYDPVGRKFVETSEQAQVFSLAPRALVDFRVSIS
jgi:hypothetical protein